VIAKNLNFEDMLTLIFAVYTLVVLTFFFILSFVALILCYPFDKRRRVVHELSRWLCFSWWYAPLTWKRKIEGLEYVDKKRPYVIVINHNSMVDIISLYFLPLNFRWVSKQEVFRIPYIGPMLWMHGDIAIQRGRATESMKKVINDGKMWLNRGVSVAIFPEGTRSKTGEIQRFKGGAFALAKEAGVEILPVVMQGTRDVFRPKSFWFNWKHRLTVKVLPPISAERVAATEPADMAKEVQEMMTEALAEIRKSE
jgi:1-acyl-sn-glycerol-3-phosphate acyltransferase